jgi:hypothetical protein
MHSQARTGFQNYLAIRSAVSYMARKVRNSHFKRILGRSTLREFTQRKGHARLPLLRNQFDRLWLQMRTRA